MRLRGLVVLVAFVASGCHGEPGHYETRGGVATFLTGEPATVAALDIGEALRLRPPRPVYVRGYLYAPADDVTRLCTRLEESGACRGSLVLDARRVDLYAADALEQGCCAIGLWSPRPVVVRVAFSAPRPRLLD